MSSEGFEITVYLELDADIGEIQKKINNALVEIEGIFDFEYSD